MSFLAPSALALLGLLPVIVLLYFLKLKRREEPISSTYLWRRAVEDLRANAPFQRLRRNLLLWLQLALLALAVVALARPASRVLRREGRRFICLIDTSASMAARDVRPNRLAEAKRQALELVANMAGEDRMMLMTFDVKPTILVPLTDDTARLRAAVNALEPRQTTTDFAAAVDLVAALGAQLRGAEVYLLSDGGFEADSLTETPDLPLRYIRIGQTGENLGITACEARRSLERPGETQVFVKVQNFGSLEADARLELYLHPLEPGSAGGLGPPQLLDARRVKVPAGDSVGVVFPYGTPESPTAPAPGLLRVVLAHEDDLAEDNTAWLVLEAPHKVRTLVVSPGNYFLETALRNDPLAAAQVVGPEEFDREVSSEALALGEFDLVIFDRHTPRSLPPGAYLFLGAVPPLEGFSFRGEVEQPVVVDWDQVHPLNRFVNYSHLFLERASLLEVPADAHTLVEGDSGPLLLYWSSPGYRVVVAAFDPLASRWPLRASFPVFLANAVRVLGGVESAGGAWSVRPGSTITFTVPPGTSQVTVTYPDGRSAQVPVRYELVTSGPGRPSEAPQGRSEGREAVGRSQEAPPGQVTFGDTYRCGPYLFTLGEKARRFFVVNLLEPRESDITPRPRLRWRRGTVAGRSQVVRENREFWPWFVLAALAVCLTEWYIYNRRVYL